MAARGMRGLRFLSHWDWPPEGSGSRSQLASLLLSYMSAVCAFVAPRHPGASAAIIGRLSHSRALSHSSALVVELGPGDRAVGRPRTHDAEGCEVEHVLSGTAELESQRV